MKYGNKDITLVWEWWHGLDVDKQMDIRNRYKPYKAMTELTVVDIITFYERVHLNRIKE